MSDCVFPAVGYAITNFLDEASNNSSSVTNEYHVEWICDIFSFPMHSEFDIQYIQYCY